MWFGEHVPVPDFDVDRAIFCFVWVHGRTWAGAAEAALAARERGHKYSPFDARGRVVAPVVGQRLEGKGSHAPLR